MKLNLLLTNLILTVILSFNSIAMSSHPYKYTYEREIEGLNEPLNIVVESDYPLSEEELEQSWQELWPRLEQDLLVNRHPYNYTNEREIEGLNKPLNIVVESDYPLSEEELEQSWQKLCPRLEQDLIEHGHIKSRK